MKVNYIAILLLLISFINTSQDVYKNIDENGPSPNWCVCNSSHTAYTVLDQASCTGFDSKYLENKKDEAVIEDGSAKYLNKRYAEGMVTCKEQKGEVELLPVLGAPCETDTKPTEPEKPTCKQL